MYQQAANIANQMATQLNRLINYCAQNFRHVEGLLDLDVWAKLYGFRKLWIEPEELNWKAFQKFVLLKIIRESSVDWWMQKTNEQLKRKWK